jgi:hypothetical protein
VVLDHSVAPSVVLVGRNTSPNDVCGTRHMVLQ